MQVNDFSFDVEAKGDQYNPNENSDFNFDPNVVKSNPVSAPSQQPSSTTLNTSVNIFRSFVGLGILALPYAFSKTGLLLSPILLLFITFISYYGVYLFLKVAEDLGFNGPKVEDLCKLAAGRKLGKLGSISVIVTQLSVCIASIVFTTDFLTFVFCQHHVENLCHHPRIYLLVSFLLSLFIIRIESLTCFSYVSLCAIVMILSSVLTITYYNATSILAAPDNTHQAEMVHSTGIANFIGIALFSMEGIGMVFPLRSSMKDVTKFHRIYAHVTVIVFAICCTFGFMNYLALGQSVTEVIFYYFGVEYRFLFMLEILYGLAIFISYPLNLSPIYEIIIKSEKFGRFFNTDSRNLNRKNRMWMRVAVLFIIYTVCFISPKLIHFISFSGALFNSWLGFILPVIIYTKYFGERRRLTWKRKTFNWIILAIGGAFSFIAVVDSLLALLGLK